MQITNGCSQILDRSPDRDPPVTIVHDPVESASGMNPKQNRRMWFLQRLGMAPDRIKVDKLSAILRCFLSPNYFHGFNLLPQHLPTTVERRPVIFHLLGVPPSANAEEQAA